MGTGGALRSEIYAHAKLCHDTIGDLEGEVPLIRAELRAHEHDACKRNRDEEIAYCISSLLSRSRMLICV